MITINCDTLATMSDGDFETLAFRVAYLQGMSKPQTPAPVERKSPPLGDKGPNELEYLRVFQAERMPLKAVSAPKFAEMGLTSREDIALACIQAGKRIGDYFSATSASVPPSPSGEDCADVETAEVDENATLESSVSLDWD